MVANTILLHQRHKLLAMILLPYVRKSCLEEGSASLEDLHAQ